MASSKKRKRNSAIEASPSKSTTTSSLPHKPKRQRTSTKSVTYAEIPSSDGNDSGENDYWEAKRILKERKWKGKIQYLIEWDGTDPEGNKWPNEWKAPADITKDLLDEWRENHPRNKRKRPSKRAVDTLYEPRQTSQDCEDRPQTDKGVVEDNSDVQDLHHSLDAPNSGHIPDVSDQPIIQKNRQAVHVKPSPAKDLSGYEFHSQLPLASAAFSSQISLSQVQSQAQSQGTLQNETPSTGTQEYGSSARPLPLPQRFQLSGIVPDSQTEDGSASYVPTTQEFRSAGAEELLQAVATAPSAISNSQSQTSFLAIAPSIEQLDPIEDSQQSQSITSKAQEVLRQLSLSTPEHCIVAEEFPTPVIEIPESPAQPEPESIERQEPTLLGSSQQVEADNIGKVLPDEAETESETEIETESAGQRTREEESEVEQFAQGEETALFEETEEHPTVAIIQHQEQQVERPASPPFDLVSHRIEESDQLGLHSVSIRQGSRRPPPTPAPIQAVDQSTQQQILSLSLGDTSESRALRSVSVANLSENRAEQPGLGIHRSHSVPAASNGEGYVKEFAAHITAQKQAAQTSGQLTAASALAPLKQRAESIDTAPVQEQTEELATAVVSVVTEGDCAESAVLARPSTGHRLEHLDNRDRETGRAPESVYSIAKKGEHVTLNPSKPLCQSSCEDNSKAGDRYGHECFRGSGGVSFGQQQQKQLRQNHSDSTSSASPSSSVPTSTPSPAPTEGDPQHLPLPLPLPQPLLQQSQEQLAQQIPSDDYISTQDSSSIRPTVESPLFQLTTHSRPHSHSQTSIPSQSQAVKGPLDRAESPQSRHDSSQESPRTSPSSPVIHHPSLLSHATDSVLPPRPETPGPSTASTNMADTTPTDTPTAPALSQAALDFAFEVEEVYRKNRERDAASRPPRQSKLTIPPLVFTSRSPSAIPDRSPRPPEPTSLKTSALINSAAVEMPAAPSLLPPAAADETSEIQPDENDRNDDEDDDPEEDPDDDDEDETASLLNDDLHLAAEEHIVPLAMLGRQKSMFIHELERHKELVMSFLQNPQEFDQLSTLETVLQRLRAVETHVDLIWTEADTTSQLTGAVTQASWDCDSCVKFRFLDALLRSLRSQELNCMVVVEKEDIRLLEMLEKFLQGKGFAYKFPAKGRVSGPSLANETLVVTLLSAEVSVVVRPADLIVCLDGTLDAPQIRKKKWATNPDRSFVPVFELVIPRSIGHIERYISPALNPKRRLHTLFATLAQVHEYIGQPMVTTPNAIDAADLVADYIITLDEQNGVPEWPLPPIGSIKTIIEFSSQKSEEAMPSPPPGGIKASKRPLDDESHDRAKRARLTPQPPSTSNSNVNDVTHISDSMPGTGAAVSNLQAQLDNEKSLRKASDKRVREWEGALDKRHNEYEELKTRYRLSLGQIEGANSARDKATERLDSRTAELDVVRTELAEQQQINLASEDDKVAEIARLRNQLAEAKESEARALRKAESAEGTLEYTKEQYRSASDRASELTRLNAKLTSDLESAEKKASERVIELKRLHLGKAYALLEHKVEDLENRLRVSEKMISQKDEEIARLSKQRSAYGTRGGSVPRSPQVRGSGSRAASPSTSGARDRVTQIKNS